MIVNFGFKREVRDSRKSKRGNQIKRLHFYFCFRNFGAALIFYKTKELGWISYVISLVSGLLIILSSIIILKEEKENEP